MLLLRALLLLPRLPQRSAVLLLLLLRRDELRELLALQEVEVVLRRHAWWDLHAVMQRHSALLLLRLLQELLLSVCRLWMWRLLVRLRCRRHLHGGARLDGTGGVLLLHLLLLAHAREEDELLPLHLGCHACHEGGEGLRSARGPVTASRRSGRQRQHLRGGKDAAPSRIPGPDLLLLLLL